MYLFTPHVSKMRHFTYIWALLVNGSVPLKYETLSLPVYYMEFVIRINTERHGFMCTDNACFNGTLNSALWDMNSVIFCTVNNI